MGYKVLIATAFTAFQLIILCSAVPQRIIFEKCGTKGFTCENSKDLPNKHDIIFQCGTNTTQDIVFYVWNFNAPNSTASLTIKDCETLRLSFTCSGENKPIQWVKIENVKFLKFLQTAVTHNPPEVYFENISYIETLPRDTFSQVKKAFYKPGCVNPPIDLHGIFFKNVNIGNIETEAFKNLTKMRNFAWSNVAVSRISVNAIHLHFHDGSSGSINKCSVDTIESLGVRVTGDGFSITQAVIGDLWGSGINGTIYDFAFNNNTVRNMQSGAIAILALHVEIINNNFETVESGAFKKISPGLLHDSRRNFGQLRFKYAFNHNLIGSVDDGGIRPDIIAYKNVAALVSYLSNTLQCSCEGLTWLGADVDLGYGYSVLKDFNTMILDPENSNMCNFTPCMCFGVRSPYKNSTSVGSIF